MVTKNPGALVYGTEGTLLYGTDGTLLFAGGPGRVFIRIRVEWDEKDLDLCAYFVEADEDTARVGYDWSSRFQDNEKFHEWYSGDNTEGGPELIDIGTMKGNYQNVRRYRIHTHWYNGSGTATITATDWGGYTQTWTVNPSSESHRRADKTDPYIEIGIRMNGEIVR